MPRCLPCLIVPLCVALGGVGCSAAQVRNPFALAKNSSRKPLQNREKSGESQPAVKAAEPAKKAKEVDAQTPAKIASRQTPASGEHDSETLALIDRELRDATPEEREALFKELKGVHPDMVRQILRVRRMGLSYQQQVQVAGSRTAPPPAKLASRTESIPDPNPRPASPRITAGMGAGPWGQTPPADPHETARPTVPAAETQMVAAFGHTAGPGVPPQDSSVVSPPAPPGADPRQHVLLDAPAGDAAQARSAAAARIAVDLQPGQYTAPDAANDAYSPLIQHTGYSAAAAAANGVPQNNSGQLINSQAARPPRPPAVSGWLDYLNRLVALTEAEAALIRPGTTEAERQIYIEKQVYLRLLYLMAGRQERALQAIPGLDPADQEFWQQTLWALTNYFDVQAIPKAGDRATQTVNQMTAAILRLQERANLELRNATFCQKISSFGNYERFPRDEFAPGQPVLLYAEVANFHSEPTADNQYRTILKSSLAIHRPGPHGDLIEQFQFGATEDVCRNRRNDYFHSYEFTIPAKLALGPHVLKLTVEDQLSKKVATYSLNFTVK